MTDPTEAYRQAAGFLHTVPTLLEDPALAMLAATQASALAQLAVADEIRRANDQRDVFNASLLEFFERLTEEPSPGPSGDGATAQVVEKEES
jgi:hypothetical protein